MFLHHKEMNIKNQDQDLLQIKMNIVRSKVSFKRLKDKELSQWQKIPTSIAGDSMNLSLIHI